MNQQELVDLIMNNSELQSECNEDDCDCDNSNQSLTDKDYIPEKIIDLDVSNIDGVVFDKDKFNDGVSSVSELCGQITALVNVGISPSEALSYLADKFMNEKAAEFNLKISEVNANANVESSKYGMNAISKMSM